MNDQKTIIAKILEIIGYTEDKDKFVAEFLQNVNLQALLDLFNTLPQDKRDLLQQNFANVGSDPSKIQDYLKANFTQEQIDQAIENSAKNAIQEYIKAIDGTLSDIQKQNLVNYFNNIAKSPSPASAQS